MNKEKTYNSLLELKKDYFPVTFKEEQKKQKEEREENKSSFGALLAKNILEGIRVQLIKRQNQ